METFGARVDGFGGDAFTSCPVATFAVGGSYMLLDRSISAYHTLE